MARLPFTLGKRKRGGDLSLKDDQRAIHLHVVGGSGRGKSTLLEHMLRQDISVGRGVCLLDPHGSLYEALVRWCTRHDIGRYRRVHLVEPRAREWCFGFNPLDFEPDALTAGVNSVVNAFAQVWGGEDLDAKPRLTRLLTALLYLLAEHRLTLGDAIDVMAEGNAKLRSRLGATLNHPYFRNEWAMFTAMGEREWREYAESAGNRLGAFLASDVVRGMVSQRDQVLDFSRAMEEGEIVLINLAASQHFSVNEGQLLGTLIVNDLLQRALLRKAGARPFYCYIDECYKFLNADVENILDQTRKYGLHMILAHQRMGQLRTYGEGVYNAVMSIQNKVVFGGLTAEDARLMAEEMFAGEFDLQRPKAKLTSPVVVAHVPEWFTSISDSEGFNEGSGSSNSDGGIQGESASSGSIFPGDGIGADVFRTTSASGSSQGSHWASSAIHSSGTQSSHTEGKTEGLRPVIEERALKEYSLEELTYEASARLKNLPVGQAVVKIISAPSAHISISKPLPGSSNERWVDAFREKTMRTSAYAQPIARAREQMTASREALARRASAPGGAAPSGTPSDEPQSFGRPKGGRGRVKSHDEDAQPDSPRPSSA